MTTHMRWNKCGLVFGPDGTQPWAAHSALQPTPFLMGDVIRVYCGMRDVDGVSSVGFVDVSATDPSVVLGISERPALSPGSPGAFDEAGVVPCAVVEHEGVLRLYYAGYTKPQTAEERFRVYCGLAISTDGGQTFERAGDEALMGPNEDAPLFRVIHSIVRDGDVWRVWYGAGSEFRQGTHKLLPVYDIRYCESPDGLTFPDTGEVAVPLGTGEHRVGRPYVVRDDAGWQMYFGGGTEATIYRLAFAESRDGRTWRRDDDALGLAVSSGEFDSEMMAYPALVRSATGTYLFYNGNDYGRAGFGYAELETTR
jgi:hypothetical protein